MYACGKCGEQVPLVYSSEDKSMWLCEQHWLEEDVLFIQRVRSSATQLRHLKKKEDRDYQQRNSIRDTYTPSKRKGHYGVPPPVEIE